jgi:membrane protein
MIHSAADDALRTHRSGRYAWRIAKEVGALAKEASARWVDDACYRLGASLAYYALFSIFPLLLLSVTAVGFFLSDDDSARQKLLNLVGSPSPEFRSLLDQTLQSMQTHRTARGVGAMVGFFALLMGASGVFSELQSSLDFIWRVKSQQTRGIWAKLLGALKSRASSFAVVLGAALALLASLAVSTGLQAVGAATQGDATRTAWQLVEIAASLVSLTGLFAAIYRIVPQTDVKWRDVVGGAFLTSVIFAGLKGLLAWYLAHIGSYAAYGAVGGVLGLMTWIYAASLILLYGAEFCRVYAGRYGSLSAIATKAEHSGRRVPCANTTGTISSPERRRAQRGSARGKPRGPRARQWAVRTRARLSRPHGISQMPLANCTH